MGTLNVHPIATIAIFISDPQSKLDTAYEAFDLLFSGRPLGHHGWNIPVLAGYPISLRSNYSDAMGTHRKLYSTHPEGPLSALSKPKECPEVFFFAYRYGEQVAYASDACWTVWCTFPSVACFFGA